MTVRVHLEGELRRIVGAESVETPLDEGSTLGDLLAAIGRAWGTRLPAHLWDGNACRFRGPVVIMIDRKAVREPSTPLREGQDVTLIKVLVGG